MDHSYEGPMIPVQFPEGPRAVRAVIRVSESVLGPFGRREIGPIVYEPAPMTGWRFSRTVDGKWFATRDVEAGR